MTGLQIFYMAAGFAIIAALLLAWCIKGDATDNSEKEPNELLVMQKSISCSIDLVVPEMKKEDKDLLSKHLAVEMLYHGMAKYKDGFEMGQQAQLHKTVDDLDPEAIEIMKNQQNAVI